MKTPVIFILVSVITFGWCQPFHTFLLSMVGSPYLLGNIEEADIRDQIDKLNPKCSNFTEKLMKETFPTFCDCVDLAVDDHNSTICEMAHDIIVNCTTPAETMFENCVTNDHKYWPSLIKKSAMSVQQYLCETRGGSIIEVINPCIWNNTEEIKEKFKKYEDELEAKFEEYKKTLPFPKELCDWLSSAPRKYLTTRMETTYCHNRETQSAILNLYDAVIAPCEHYNAVESYKNTTYT